ncbi:MAG: M42 family peptidase, partial [candidate division WOR-3 bacterium]
MNITELDSLLERLTKSYGIGYSGGVKYVVLDELKRKKISGEISKDGSVYGFLKGIKKTEIMLSAHLDEIGFIVSLIEDNGFIRFRDMDGGDV